MKNDKTSVRCLARALLAGISAGLLVVGLSLLLSRFQALAQPAAEIAALKVDKQVNTDWAAPGDTLTYTIRIEDMSAFYPTVWMTDTLPDDVTYVPGSLQHLELPGRSVGYANGVITWTASNFGYGFDIISFSVEISSETTAAQIVNTVQVTGTGELLTDSETTDILSGQPPTSQIRSPNRDAVITQKGSLTISGYAWDEGIKPPFLTGDIFLTAERVTDRAYLLRWTPVVSASYYLVEEATDPQFSSPQSIYFGPDTEYPHTRDTDGTYYYRVKASASEIDPSRWSNVESVVVPWTAGATNASMSNLSTDVAANGSITVQVRIDGGDWHNAIVTTTTWGGWEWTYAWALPEERSTQHTIKTWASDAGGIFGPTDTITVTLDNKNYIQYLLKVFKRWPPRPYGPVLNDIENADGNRDYTVSWSYGDHPDAPVITYTLQEATDADFTNPTNYYPGGNTSQAINNAGGTYYYRVRGHNTWGPGLWSNVKSVTVRSYHYDFNSPTKVMDPWPIRRTSYWRGDLGSGRVTWTEEHDGTMYILMNDKWDFTIGSPFEVAPSPPYAIQVRAKVHDPGNLIAYGIIFGGNGGSPCPAYRDTGCLTHYYRLEVVWDGKLKAQLKRIDYHESESSNDRGKGRGQELIGYTYIPGGGEEWNTWKFVVKPDGIDVYINGEFWRATSDNRYVNEPYFGVYASANEYKPAIGRFDYFYVDPQ